jgi:hypothetical protein
MPGPRATRRTRRFKPGMAVQHRIHGVGRVVAEWGPLFVADCTAQKFTSGKGIFDVEFGVRPHRYFHCAGRNTCRDYFSNPASPMPDEAPEYTIANDYDPDREMPADADPVAVCLT